MTQMTKISPNSHSLFEQLEKIHGQSLHPDKQALRHRGDDHCLDTGRAVWPDYVFVVIAVICVVSILMKADVIASTGGILTMLSGLLLPLTAVSGATAVAFAGFVERRWILFVLALAILAFYIALNPFFIISALLIWGIFVLA